MSKTNTRVHNIRINLFDDVLLYTGMFLEVSEWGFFGNVKLLIFVLSRLSLKSFKNNLARYWFIPDIRFARARKCLRQ